MNSIDGKKIASGIDAEITRQLTTLERSLSFHCLLVGDDPASHLYVRRKEKMAQDLGISFTLHHLAAEATVEIITEKTRELNLLPDGYIIQLPLPTKLREKTNDLLQQIDPARDVDGLTKINRERFLNDTPGSFLPTPVAAVMALVYSLSGDDGYRYLPFYHQGSIGKVNEDLFGKQAIVISDGDVFGPTLRVALARAGMQVEVVRSDDATLVKKTERADLLVSAVGKPGSITGNMLKRGVVGIDVGTTLVNGRTKGDFDWESVSAIASAATPVPGGVGPVTVAMLYANLLYLAKRQDEG
ncbi:hypothetical protein COV04_04050 [Candidatus Uhrbacteria bacterium CG10_big_fil_rev_8_21_14_0_10_48_11]|uniref:Bifunctional protein FolD n=1 Tax=Candidatus Uhrbacteria bacterium CG10_big_fil_rev_8_21_14_0_10_48_11 TaxID=1975037 RepID=A0A2M8LDQ0_9BACT|nr:MAG: hypothetical protein COV04_04050 [Candidatus Uhrbacteria bacterium CG10_big_fil_rev_8_21_14_0_10_48_11]